MMMMGGEYQTRTVHLQLNGVADSRFVQFDFAELKWDYLRRFAQRSFGMKFSKMRVFTEEGVEVFPEDLQYVKSGAHLHLSEGGDFDQWSCFAIYQIVRQLGEGGFGKVLLGRHRVTSDLAAIKIIETLKIGNAVDIDMVFREAELMKSLVHRNIVRIYNCYTLKNMQVVIVMEFLEGGELLEHVQEQGRLSEEEACFLFKQISEAVAYCHNQKLIHRDLKLENILLANKQDRLIKIADFGIAGIASHFNPDKLDVGSLSYMAPEILSGKASKLGPPIDIWALGIILYGMHQVCGCLPFTKVNQSQTINAIIEGVVNYPSTIALSADLKDLIERMLRTNESERIRMLDILQHPWVQQTLDLGKLGSVSQEFSASRKGQFKKENSRVTFGGIIGGSHLHKQPTQKLASSPTGSSLRSETKKLQLVGGSTKSHFQNCFTQSPIKVDPQQPTKQAEEKLDDSNMEIIHLGTWSMRKLVTKDYSSVLLKYRQDTSSSRKLVNPFLKDLERQQRKEKFRQRSLMQPVKSKLVPQTPASSTLVSNFSKRFEYYKSSILSKIKTRRKFGASVTPRTEEKRFVEVSERLKTISPSGSVVPLEGMASSSRAAHPGGKQRETASTWLKQLKLLTPIVQYDLQHQFMQRRKNIESTFQCTFLSSFRNSKK